jgi:signal transduction histidine kinase
MTAFASSSAVPGKGLGLRIVTEIMSNMKADVFTESELGCGTNVTLLVVQDPDQKRMKGV